MSTLLSAAEESGYENPLNHLELIISENEWPYEKVGDDEITASIPCQWGEYCLRAVWIEDESVLHLAATMDLKVTAEKKTVVMETINMINERLPLGHLSSGMMR